MGHNRVFNVLFSHTFMLPDSPVSHMKIAGCQVTYSDLRYWTDWALSDTPKSVWVLH